MPASSFDFYLQDARNNFDAVRPAPIPTDANVFMGQCQNSIHVSTNCYYGFHDTKNTRNQHVHVSTDCEMLEIATNGTSPQTTAKKRSADNADFPQSKRLRQEVQKEKSIEPETKETLSLDTTTEDLLETLYWNIHGGHVFQLIQYDSPMCSLVGTRSSPSHSASAFNVKILPNYILNYIKGFLKLNSILKALTDSSKIMNVLLSLCHTLYKGGTGMF